MLKVSSRQSSSDGMTGSAANLAILSASAFAFRRHVQQGENAEAVASELGITVNNLYQIKNRIKQRIADEVRSIRENSPDGN